MLKNKTEKNRNDEKYNQTGITVKIHTNHDGVRATAIMLRSIAASSSWRSSVIAVKQATGTTSTTLRVEKLEFALISFPMRWMEGHISQCSRVLRCCHSERSSCRSEFGCRSFVEHSPWTVCFLLVMWNNLRDFVSHNLAEFHWTFHFQILY